MAEQELCALATGVVSRLRWRRRCPRAAAPLRDRAAWACVAASALLACLVRRAKGQGGFSFVVHGNPEWSAVMSRNTPAVPSTTTVIADNPEDRKGLLKKI